MEGVVKKHGLIHIKHFFKKCISEGEGRNTRGDKKVKKNIFQDWRRWLNLICLGNELETRERKAGEATEKARAQSRRGRRKDFLWGRAGKGMQGDTAVLHMHRQTEDGVSPSYTGGKASPQQWEKSKTPSETEGHGNVWNSHCVGIERK